MRQHQLLAEQPAAQIGQKTQQRAGLDHARARHVGDHHAVLAQHVDQARHTELRRGVELKRIKRVGIHPAQQHVEPLQPGHGADVDAIALDREIVALDQQEAEIARQSGVLEIGLAEGARRQHADPRLVAIGAGAQTVAERLEERRHPFDIHRFIQVGEGARQHQPVLQRIARTGRRLRAVAQHPPAPVGAAADVGGIEAEIAPARRLDAADRAQIFGAAGDRRGRHRAFRHQPAGAVEIGQNLLEQGRALRNARGDMLPFGGVDQQRHMAQRPGAIGGFAGRPIGDTSLAQMPVGGTEAALDLCRRQRRESLEESGPDLARGAVGADEFVGDAGQPNIIARPLRPPCGPRGRSLLPWAASPAMNWSPENSDDAVIQRSSPALSPERNVCRHPSP